MELAFGVTFSQWFFDAITIALGGSVVGVAFTGDTYTYSNRDLSGFGNYDGEPVRYTSMSGSVSGTTTAIFDFTLSGGPINTLSYSLSDQQLNANTFIITVTANDKQYDLTY